MSMPNIPNVTAKIDIDKEKTINLLLASIAFEELGLAHMINAEAEKIQFVLGMLENSTPEELPTLIELLKVNKSVDHIMKAVIEKEMLLGFKFENVLELTTMTASTTSTHTTTSTQSTTSTTTIKKSARIVEFSADYSEPEYIGGGSGREGSTTVTLSFVLEDGTPVTKEETFTGIKETTSEDFDYTIGDNDVSVKITLIVEGTNNNMHIVDVTAALTPPIE